ncbi:hypothetical protein [Candidatus Electronema sp. JC]|uniref:hypothetical protein n=1 Tax=Candidatus Electronema sp. JC TaxID=3401570 RepID=UPI003B436F01
MDILYEISTPPFQQLTQRQFGDGLLEILPQNGLKKTDAMECSLEILKRQQGSGGSARKE